MKTILTIDFNIIMAPCIDLYNHLINEFDNLHDRIGSESLVWHGQAAMDIYSKLTNEIILDKFLEVDKDNIHFLHGQEDVLHFLDKNEDNHVYNIDFYSDTHEYNGTIDNRNWVTYGLNNGYIKNYEWIKALNSPIVEGVETPVTVEKAELTLLPNIDQIFIASSEEWILPQYMPLFDLWLMISRKILGKNVNMEDYYQLRGEY